MQANVIFYILGLVSFLCGVGVITIQNPIYSALCLAGTMISLAGLFVTLDAFFIAGVQLIVYAGAVMVLFVMVLMLFDLKHEMKTFSKGLLSAGFKLAAGGMLLGAITGAIWISSLTSDHSFQPTDDTAVRAIESTKTLAQALFTRYIFSFEAIGVMLLAIAVGAVALSRISGGTHAD